MLKIMFETTDIYGFWMNSPEKINKLNLKINIKLQTINDEI